MTAPSLAPLRPALLQHRAETAHSRSLVYLTKCLKVLPCANGIIIAIVIREPAQECLRVRPGPHLLLSSRGSREYRAGQGTGEGRVCASLGKGPGSVSSLGAYFDSEILELSLAFAFKSCITLGVMDPAFPVEKLPLPLLVCMSSLGVFVSACPVSLSVPVILRVGLCIFLSLRYGGGGGPLLSLPAFPWICVCPPPTSQSPMPSLCLFSVDIFVFLTHLNAQNSWLSWCLR